MTAGLVQQKERCATEWTHLYIVLIDNCLDSRAERTRGIKAVDVRQDGVVLAVLECATEKAGILQIIQSNGAEPLESQGYKVEVLRDNGCRRSREVERERVFDAASEDHKSLAARKEVCNHSYK